MRSRPQTCPSASSLASSHGAGREGTRGAAVPVIGEAATDAFPRSVCWWGGADLQGGHPGDKPSGRPTWHLWPQFPDARQGWQPKSSMNQPEPQCLL